MFVDFSLSITHHKRIIILISSGDIIGVNIIHTFVPKGRFFVLKGGVYGLIVSNKCDTI